MKILNITKSISILAISLLILTSCENFLDVEPNSQIKGETLFDDENGFKEALAGVYTSMITNGNTYACHLRFGLIGVLGAEWDYYPTSSYQDIVQYDYNASIPTGLIASLWGSMYTSISYTNDIINNIDAKKQIFSDNNYQIIKGEAHALRAMLHFDLLRCFGVSYSVNKDMPAIPYYTELSKKVAPQLTVSQTMERIMADLIIADSLLINDPIKTGQEITNAIDNGYLTNRHFHLNYYAVKALQARAYMWMGNYTEAESCAKEVIDSKMFEWSDPTLMAAKIDLCGAPEQIFALNHEKLSGIHDSYFSPDYSSSGFYSKVESIQTLFDSKDYRYLNWYKVGEGTKSSNSYITKYKTPDYGNDQYDEIAGDYVNRMAVIRLSEMYLILAECQYRNQNYKALDALNTVRKARNLTEYFIEPTDFIGAIIDEYKREFMSEGVIFFLYKRLNVEFTPNSSISMYDSKGYTFPIPKTETEFAIREENR